MDGMDGNSMRFLLYKPIVRKRTKVGAYPSPCPVQCFIVLPTPVLKRSQSPTDAGSTRKTIGTSLSHPGM